VSIYLSLSTLEDPEIMDTVRSAILQAKKPEELFIGVAFTTGAAFYERAYDALHSLPNVKLMYLDPHWFSGIGMGRNMARFAYDDQDHIVQTDSHANFTWGWDETVVSLHNKVSNETGYRTILTGYAPPYRRVKGQVVEADRYLRYSVYLDKKIGGAMLRDWGKMPVKNFPDNLSQYKDEWMLPANKIGADFMVGNKEWARTGLPHTAIFWEEEVLQSINLLEDGFSLVFPNVEVPITHRYYAKGEAPSRQAADELYESTESIVARINKNVADFIKDNYDACKRYAEYSGYDLTNDTLSGIVIPRTYGFDTD
jgi:Glycosyltransferase (GlcNAc)